MKKMLLIIAMCMAAAGLFAQTNEVSSVNVVGYYKVTIPTNSYAMVGIKLNTFDATNQTLMGVLGTNTVRGNSFAANSDQVYVWDAPTQRYITYALKPTDMQYHSTANWGGAASNPPVVAGGALWIKTPSTGTFATQQLDMVIIGQVIDVTTQSIHMIPGLQMVTYPFSQDIQVDSLNFAGAKSNAFAASADQLMIWNGTAYTILGLKSDGRWHYSTNWGGAAASNLITMGQGFWYNSRTNFYWNETNRYIGNL